MFTLLCCVLFLCYLLYDVGDQEGLCTWKCVEDMELEVREWFNDEWGLFCWVWTKGYKCSQDWYQGKAWEIRIRSHSFCRCSEVYSKQAMLNQIYIYKAHWMLEQTEIVTVVGQVYKIQSLISFQYSSVVFPFLFFFLSLFFLLPLIIIWETRGEENRT